MKTNTSRILTTALIALTAITAITSTSTATETPVRRYLLSVGSNDGGRDRVLLRYAVADAADFAAVLTEMGGVDKRDAAVLADPAKDGLLKAFSKMEAAIAKDANGGGRSEAFVYYSGHADADGLKLGGETLGWRDFRNAVNSLGADVRVAIVDACGSGAITRAKGGAARPAFLSDASSDMKGYAFLTSSNANESSQESDRIKGGYFTRALLNGMRGAADLSGDGTVTVNEAYQYAFNETLRSTQNTYAGTQHPSRDMNLAGTGDILLTDLRRTTATLAFDRQAEGRLFIRDTSGNLFAELRKQGGRPLEIGIPKGRYSVRLESPSGLWAADGITVAEGGRTPLSTGDFKKTGKARTAAKGGAESAYAESDYEETGFGGKALAGLRTAAYKGIFDAALSYDAAGSAGAAVRAGLPWVYGIAEYNTLADIKFIDKTPAPADSLNVAPPENGGDRNPSATGGKRDTLKTASGCFGLGIGTRFGMNGPFLMNLDLVNRVVGHGDMNHGFFRLRLGASYSPSPYFALSAGTSLNAVVNYKSGAAEYEPSIRYRYKTESGGACFWPDFYVGMTTGKILSGGGRRK